MSETQKDCDVTIEIEDECFSASLRIADEEHASLDKDHPIIFMEQEPNERFNDVEKISNIIGLAP